MVLSCCGASGSQFLSFFSFAEKRHVKSWCFKTRAKKITQHSLEQSPADHSFLAVIIADWLICCRLPLCRLPPAEKESRRRSASNYKIKYPVTARLNKTVLIITGCRHSSSTTRTSLWDSKSNYHFDFGLKQVSYSNGCLSQSASSKQQSPFWM